MPHASMLRAKVPPEEPHRCVQTSVLDGGAQPLMYCTSCRLVHGNNGCTGRGACTNSRSHSHSDHIASPSASRHLRPTRPAATAPHAVQRQGPIAPRRAESGPVCQTGADAVSASRQLSNWLLAPNLPPTHRTAHFGPPPPKRTPSEQKDRADGAAQLRMRPLLSNPTLSWYTSQPRVGGRRQKEKGFGGEGTSLACDIGRRHTLAPSADERYQKFAPESTYQWQCRKFCIIQLGAMDRGSGELDLFWAL